jgi:hypothetical protein
VNSLTQPLYTRADLFGSNCVHQDFNASRRKTLPMTGVEDTCFGVNSEDARLEAETTPATSTIGESVRLTACMRIADNMTYTQTALTRAGLTITSPINDTNVKTLYQRFYPGIDPSVNLLEDIREIGEQAVARPAVVATPGKTKLLEGWRYMMLAVCMSPGWQAP